ncbi:MAG: hypothetical protein KF749_14835 [Bacteroidetes bacterium]|nr:hypothetical protein [Bacteroidota bacterium]MCW5895994.1 hypothetical protein [Bacteroidota bacterium]
MTRACSILFSLFFGILETAAQSDATDIFPLTKGLRCLYQYHENYYWWSWGSSGGSTDSAIAECVVIDSTMISDTTRVWTVIQINYRANAVDTVTFSLRESTTGYHNLTSEASPWYEDSRIWAFPVVFQSQVFPVFRFSD